MVKRVSLNKIHGLASPMLVIEASLNSAEGIIVQSNYLDIKMRDKHNGVNRTARASKAHDKQGFFDEISAALQFPSYFGENWDALDECINDLDWLPATDSYLLLITDADQLLEDGPFKDLEILMTILEKTAKNWSTGFNHDNLVRAYQAEVVPKTSKFSIVFHVGPDADMSKNFGVWLKNMDLPKISLVG